MSYYHNLIETGIAYDTDAQSFFTASGITDATQKSAVNQLVLDLKSASIWTKFKAIYPFVGGDATKHSYNLINTSLYQISWSSGWTHSSTGANPNGTNAYADTTLNSSTTLSLNSTHISTYTRENLTENSASIGNYTGSTELSIFPKYGGTSFLYAVNGAEYGVSNTDSRGFFVSNRASSTQVTAWRNGSKLATTSSTSTSLSNKSITLAALNEGSARYYFSSNELAIATIGDGLTDTDVLNLYNAIQTYQTTLSRQV